MGLIGMHLHGKIGLGIQKFNQQWEVAFGDGDAWSVIKARPPAAAALCFSSTCSDRFFHGPLVTTPEKNCPPCTSGIFFHRPGAAIQFHASPTGDFLPSVGSGFSVNRTQPIAAPDAVLKDRFKFQRIHNLACSHLFYPIRRQSGSRTT